MEPAAGTGGQNSALTNPKFMAGRQFIWETVRKYHRETIARCPDGAAESEHHPVTLGKTGERPM
jgi:hypothetical protein